MVEKSLTEDYKIIEIYKDGKVIEDVIKDFKISKKRINVKVKCNKCGNIWKTDYYGFMRCKCKVCQNNLNAVKKIEQTKLKYYDKIIELCKQRNYEFLGFSNNNDEDCEWYGASTYLKLKCNKCGNIWNTCTCYNFVHHLRGCPKCNQSHLELCIEEFLKRENIDFVPQKRFDWLGYLSLDFYLPKYNVGIECQGKQHFRKGGWVTNKDVAKKNYEKSVERDVRKLKLCKENNVKLLYFSNLHIDYPYEVIEDEGELLQKILEN